MCKRRLTNVTAIILFSFVVLLAWIPVHAKDLYLSPFTIHLFQTIETVCDDINTQSNTETLQAILMQETRGGNNPLVGGLKLPASKRSYGVMQVQIVAARSVIKSHPDISDRYFNNKPYKIITDNEIVNVLLTNHEANIRIAAIHLSVYQSITRGDWPRAVAAYNAGIGTALKMRKPLDYVYVKQITYNIRTIINRYNQQKERIPYEQ